MQLSVGKKGTDNICSGDRDLYTLSLSKKDQIWSSRVGISQYFTVFSMVFTILSNYVSIDTVVILFSNVIEVKKLINALLSRVRCQ